MRLRILAGTGLLVLGLAFYAAAVATISRSLLPAATMVQLGFFVVAGLAWIYPAALLTRWMQRAAPHHPPPGA